MNSKNNDDEMAEKIDMYIETKWAMINYLLEQQQRQYKAKKGKGIKPPIRPPREKMTKKTRDNLERIKQVLCNKTKYDNLRRILTEYERWKILIDFYIIADGLKIDGKKRKKEGNKNKNVRLMDSKGNYFFAMPIDKFIDLRKGTRNSISKNINLFAFLELIEKRNPYTIETAFIIKQEQKRQDKISMIEGAVKRGILELGERKNDFNFSSLYIIPGLNNKIFKEAEQKASKLYEVNFSIRAFTSIFLSMYFGVEEASKVYFHTNLLEFTEYSNFLQGEIKDAVIYQINVSGYATKENTYKLVAQFCLGKNFEILERYGRPHTSSWNTFQTEFKRTIGKILQEYPYIKLSNNPNNQMKQVFNLKNGKQILYDSRKLKEKN